MTFKYPAGNPEAVLIRSVEGTTGLGRVGKLIGSNRSFYGEDLETSTRLWIENTKSSGTIITSSRIGIDYAGAIWKNKPWRFELKIN